MNKIIFIILIMASMVKGQGLDIKPKVKFLALGDSYTIGQSIDDVGQLQVEANGTVKAFGLKDIAYIQY